MLGVRILVHFKSNMARDRIPRKLINGFANLALDLLLELCSNYSIIQDAPMNNAILNFNIGAL